MVPMAGWSSVAFACMLSFNTARVHIAVGLSEKIEKVSYTTPKNGWSRLTKHMTEKEMIIGILNPTNTVFGGR